MVVKKIFLKAFNKIKKARVETVKWAIFIFVVTAVQLIFIYAFFVEPNWIAVEKIRIVNPKISKALGGLRVVHLSDLEIANFGYLEVSLIEKINKLEPDLILITGDLVNERKDLQFLMDVLNLLNPKFHTYLIFGDEDGCISDLANSDIWEKAKASFVEEKAVRLNLKGKDDTYFWLVGSSQREAVKDLTKDIPSSEPVILMSHKPDMVKWAALAGVDLVLAGHTQGGQVGIALIRKLFPYSQKSVYISGLFKIRNTLLYVNRGITSDKSIRFLCRPEITVLDFVAKGQETKPQVLKQDRWP